MKVQRDRLRSAGLPAHRRIAAREPRDGGRHPDARVDRVAAMMVAEDLDLEQLVSLARRLLADRIFGLERILPDVPIHSQAVGGIT